MFDLQRENGEAVIAVTLGYHAMHATVTSTSALRVSAPSRDAPQPAPLFRTPHARTSAPPSLFESLHVVRDLSVAFVRDAYEHEQPRFARTPIVQFYRSMKMLSRLSDDDGTLALNLCLVEAHRIFWHRHGRYRVLKAKHRGDVFVPTRVVRVERGDYQWSPEWEHAAVPSEQAMSSVVYAFYSIAKYFTGTNSTAWFTHEHMMGFCRNLMRNWALMLHARGFMALVVEGLEDDFNARVCHGRARVVRSWRAVTARTKAVGLLRPRWDIRLLEPTRKRKHDSDAVVSSGTLADFPMLFTHVYAGALDCAVDWNALDGSPLALVRLAWQASWVISSALRVRLARALDVHLAQFPQEGALRGALRDRARSLGLWQDCPLKHPLLLVHPNHTCTVQHGGLWTAVPLDDPEAQRLCGGRDGRSRWEGKFELPLPLEQVPHTNPRVMFMDLLGTTPVPEPRPMRMLREALFARGVLWDELVRDLRRRLALDHTDAAAEATDAGKRGS